MLLLYKKIRPVTIVIERTKKTCSADTRKKLLDNLLGRRKTNAEGQALHLHKGTLPMFSHLLPALDILANQPLQPPKIELLGRERKKRLIALH